MLDFEPRFRDRIILRETYNLLRYHSLPSFMQTFFNKYYHYTTTCLKHCYTDLLISQKAWLCWHFDPEQAQLKIYLRLDDHTMWLATAKSRLSCYTQVRCYSSVIKRLQFNCPHISGTTYINMWALFCKVSIVCMWKNGVHPPLQSLSNL